MIQRLLRRWAESVYRHHVLVLVVLAAVTVACSLSLFRLELSADVRSLLPDDSRAVRAYFDLKESFGADLMILVFEVESGQVLEHVDYIDGVADALADSPLVDEVDHRVYENVPTDLFLRNLPLLLRPDELDVLAQRVTSEQVEEQVWLDWIDLQGPMVPPLLKKLLREDPLRLLELLRDRLVTSRGGYSLDVSSGYYVSHDETTLLMFVRPSAPSDDIEFSKELLARIDALLGSVRAEYLEDRREDPSGEIAGLDVGVTGAHAITAIESEVLQGDMLSAVLWSLAAVLLLFVLTFRRIDAVLFVGVPLVAALLWTFGLTWVVVGRLNMLSTGFAAVVLGLGVDYAIHIYNRFLDHRGQGDDTETSIEAAVAETGSGVVVGATTTAGAFFALMLYDFRGIREFGFIAGAGVLLALVSMLTLLPAMLSLRERWAPVFHQRTLPRFHTRELVAFVAARPKRVLAASAVATIVLAGAASQVEWEGRILADDFSANPALQLREELRERFSSSPDSLILVIEGASLAEVADAGRRAHEAALALQREERIGAVDSISSYLRPRDEQRRTMERLASDPALDGERIVADLRRALGERGFAIRPFEPHFDVLRDAFSPDEPVGIETLVEAGGDEPFLQRYVSGRPGRWTQALYMTSGTRGFDGGDLDVIEQRLAEDLPEMTEEAGAASGSVEAYLAGGKVLARELRQRMRGGYATVTAVALVLVLLVLGASFRRPARIALALVPLVLGVTWMLGIMSFAGVAMNVINVPVTAMILGIGIDDAVHVVHGFYNEAGMRVSATYRTTGKALVLTTLTTCAGFGSLVFAGHPGLASMGLLAILGTVCCLVATLVTVPALMSLAARRAGVEDPAPSET